MPNWFWQEDEWYPEEDALLVPERKQIKEVQIAEEIELRLEGISWGLLAVIPANIIKQNVNMLNNTYKQIKCQLI